MEPSKSPWSPNVFTYKMKINEKKSMEIKHVENLELCLASRYFWKALGFSL